MLPPWILRQLSRLPSLYPEEPKKGDTKWICGLRGICACSVVCHHLFMALHGDVIHPGSRHARLHGLWHWPFFHAFTEGFQWVAMFLVLAAWVNAIKPLQAMDSNYREGALASLAKAALRRPLRLMLPAGIVTILSCVLAQMNVFHFGTTASGWMNQSTPTPEKTLWKAFKELMISLWGTWFDAGNHYENNQWILKWFLEGSWKLYAALLPMTMMSPTWRRAILIIQWLWAWKTQEVFVTLPTYTGLVFAQLSMSARVNDYAFSSATSVRVISPILFLFGWYLMSYPGVNEQWAPWFEWIWAHKKFWYGEGNTYRLTCTIGVYCVLTSILISSSFQSIFNAPLLQWLGQHSFAIYLLHGIVMRTVLMFFCYGIFTSKDRADPTGLGLFLSLFFFIVATLAVARLWVIYVEPWCSQLIESIDQMLGSHIDPSKLIHDILSVHEPDKMSDSKSDFEKHSLPVTLVDVTVVGANRLD